MARGDQFLFLFTFCQFRGCRGGWREQHGWCRHQYWLRLVCVQHVAWITITGGASGTGNGTVGYSVASNTTATSRIGTITIAGQTFTVTQAGVIVVAAPVCTLTASPAYIAPGTSSTLTASCTPAASSYTWTNTGFGTSSSGGTVMPSSTSVYSVSGTNSGGSSPTVSVGVAVGTALSSTLDMRTYVPAATEPAGYVSSVRVINNGGVSTPVLVARIDGTTGQVGAWGVLTTALPVDATVIFTAQQIETALGQTMTASDRPRLRISGVTSPVEVQSLLRQPGGLYNEVSGFQSGSVVKLRYYIPFADMATSGYTSFVRVINPGLTATSVSIAVIDGVTGMTGPAYTLNGNLPGGAAQTIYSQDLEAIIGPIAVGTRPRLKISASTTLEVQSFIVQPGGAFTIISTGQ